MPIDLETVLGSLPELVITVDRNLKVLHANKPIHDFCSRPWERGRSKPLPSLADFSRSQCFEVIRRVLDSGQPVVDQFVQCCRGVRPAQRLILNGIPLRDEGGTCIGAVLVARDITGLDVLGHKLADPLGYGNIIGKSERMQNVYDLIHQLADVDASVLITGESGTGKELVADALHHGGKRANGPFVKVNCAALSESILESELFGHAKGAFTGAVTDAVGRFEAAHGGTLFLDEIGDISPRLQLSLLRAIETKKFERLGESKTRKVDIKIIAATNANLEERVQRGLFRTDLYYRLKVMIISLPPLRDRTEDIPLLVQYFVSKFNKIYNKSIKHVSSSVQRKMLKYVWPGNVRELKHAIEHACILCYGDQIGLQHLPISCFRLGYIRPPQTKRCDNADRKPDVEQSIILDALRRTDWNKSKAARILGISRLTLYHKIARYQLQPDE